MMPLLSSRRFARPPLPGDGDCGPVAIGLVNNMPDAALRTTEQQFRGLLNAAPGKMTVCLRLFSLPELARGDAARAHIEQHYEDLGELRASPVDGLIVTGTEARAPALTDEPYWPSLASLVDWAEQHTISAIWSCLAAHAAVFRIDGIDRHRLPGKLSGVFECARAADHPIIADARLPWRMPHSRYNGLSEAALVAHGYRILSRSQDVGADMFVKQGKSLFVFVQGHPEYDSGALFREYRRDVGRFLAGARDLYPEIPCGCFDETTAAAFDAFREWALQDRCRDLLASFPTVAAERLSSPWRGPAARVFENWLEYLVQNRSRSRNAIPWELSRRSLRTAG